MPVHKKEKKMRISILLVSLTVLMISLYKVSVLAEGLSVFVAQSDDTVSLNRGGPEDGDGTEKDIESNDVEEEAVSVADPFEPVNRAIFIFNDKLYFWIVKPIYKGYNVVVPEKARLSVRKFFWNIRMPKRFINCLLQARFKGAGIEISRFVINTTIGIGGLFDPARSIFHLKGEDRDFGQTLAKYGVGHVVFIEWPIFGPTTVQTTLGAVGDIALDPITLLSFFVSPLASAGANSYDQLNNFSLDRGETYENVAKAAIDPYIAIKEAHVENRNKKIEE